MKSIRSPGAAIGSVVMCGLPLLASLVPGAAHAAFSPFGDGALGASASILGTSSQSAFDTRPLPPTPGQFASVAFGQQDPSKSVGSAGVLATAGFGRLGGSSSASASWDPIIDGIHGGGAMQSGTGFTGSPGGLRMTFFGDVLTVNAAGLAGQKGVAHASLLLSTLASTSLPNIHIGDAASEEAWVGFSADVVTGPEDIWGESGLRPATSHLQVAGGLWMANGAAYQGGQNQNEMQVLDQDRVVYDGVVKPNFVLALDITIVFGQAFSLSAQLQSSALATVSAPALPLDDPSYPFTRYAFAQGSVSLTWAGISSVDVIPASPLAGASISAAATPGLAALTDFSVVSESGTDYRHALSPVPEPHPALLFLAGCTWLGWRRRSSRDTSAARI